MAKRAIIVGYWSYEGNSPNGKDHARKGDLKLARYAHDYWSHAGGQAVERVRPGYAHLRAEKSAFGRTYAFRIVDLAALQRWIKLIE